MPALRKVLGEAFAPDPLFQWLFPDEATRVDAAAAWLGLFVERYVSRNTDPRDRRRQGRGRRHLAGAG